MNDILSGLVEGVIHVDIVTLSHVLGERKDNNRVTWLELIGGVAYLASLTEGLPMRPVIGEYVGIISEKSRLRRLTAVFNSGIAQVEAQSGNASDVATAVENQMADIVDEASVGVVRIGSITASIEQRVSKKRVVVDERRTALEMTWGLDKLDAATHGCFRGEFTILGGESSGGKTAMAVQIAIANALEGTPVAIFSMEMTKESIASRFYPSMSEVLTNNHMRDPRLMNTHTHVPEMKRISRELSRLPIDIDDRSPVRIDKLKARIKMMRRKWKQESDSDKILIIADYLQLIKGMPGMSPLDQFSHILYTLRDIPKEEPDVHLLVLSQYSQGDKFMKKSGRTKDSLYGGSVIHHTAQNVFMISIEDPDKRDDLDLLDAEIKIAKQREGKRTKVNCNFDRDHLRFCYAQRVMTGDGR
jgi:replicative DNA helicase